MIRAYSLGEVAEQIGATERWLAGSSGAGQIPGHKIAGHWQMTDADVEAVLEFCARPAAEHPMATAHPIGMTPTSRRRVRRAS
jgi:hypothetical protein